MEKISVLVLGGEPSEVLLESLAASKELIKEVLYPAYPACEKEISKGNSKPEIELIPVISQDFYGGALRNELLSRANSDYFLFLSPNSSFDEDFIGELLEEKLSSAANLVYSNLIIRRGDEEEVKNYQQLNGKELSLVASLSPEEWVPEVGVLTDRFTLEKGGFFDEELYDYEFYDFLYRNARWIKLSLSEFSYLEFEQERTFIDTSVRSFVLRNRVLKEYDWERELFPFLSWKEKPEVARATALTIIGRRLVAYYDLFNATDFFRRALLSFHNQETLKDLISSLVRMGLFEEALGLLSETQGVPQEAAEAERKKVKNIELLINELEKAVKEGKLYEVIATLPEILEFYEGAPVLNLMGVINWLGKDLEGAFKAFYKAVTMNPINRDYLFNLTSVAKELSKEEQVKRLIKNLVGERDG